MQSTIDKRYDDIKKIVEGVKEVNGLMQDLQLLVNEQTPLIDNIESNVINSSNDVKDANTQLEEANRLF